MRRFRAIKAIVWTNMIIVVSTLVSGSTYLSALLVLAILIAFVTGIGFRIFRRLTRKKTPLDPALKERVQKLVTEVSLKIRMKHPARFLVVRGLFGAGATRGNRVLVGEKLAQESDDWELEGAIGHELAHVLRKHPLIKAGTKALTVALILMSFVWAEPGSTWQIVVPVVLSLLVVLEAPLYWKLEYDADAKAAELLGAEIILLTLRKLKTRSFDGISFTHPPLSRRIRRIRRLFPDVGVETPTTVSKTCRTRRHIAMFLRISN